MKIASRYQVFRDPVEISEKDEERLKVHLKGWNRLNEILLLGINEPDLRRLVVLELMNQRRPVIIDRLLGRLAKIERKSLNDRIARLFV